MSNFTCSNYDHMLDSEQEILLIANRIKEARKKQGLTVQELAYRCDMERSSLNRIELGKVNVTIKTICKICNAMNIKISDIIK